MLHYSPYANFDVLNTIFSLNMGLYLCVFLNTLSQATDYLGLMYCPSPYKTAKLRAYCFSVFPARTDISFLLPCVHTGFGDELTSRL